ncbi:hypothetical protein KFL_004230100 [Klebsormidium nitens]|uniref:SWIM-type domain-containing protein n=1 Tax=Klebsormidium nitens TaxID=105231 RepID=A0A1Y1IIA8_KLENI|nr:hypothetical protein KFL_004230100 [Klebsormidium nitens]|eukprot:GAQ88387.1 hypothetical protein KFL_004230100 [Klebsormidium nitens]
MLSGRKANWKLYETVLDRERKALKLSETAGAINILDYQSGHAMVASKAAILKLAERQEQSAGNAPERLEKMFTVVLRGGFCDCEDPSGLLCKHIRAAARMLGGLEKWNLNLDNLREEVLMEVKSAEMEQQETYASSQAPGAFTVGVDSDVEDGYEKGVKEHGEIASLRREFHGVLDKIGRVEPWTNAKGLLKEVLIRVNADLRQEERTIKAKSFTQFRKKKKGGKRKRAAEDEMETKDQANANTARQGSSVWAGLNVGARPKRAKQANHPRQAEDEEKISKIAANLVAWQKAAAEDAAPALPIRTRQEAVTRYKLRKTKRP